MKTMAGLVFCVLFMSVFSGCNPPPTVDQRTDIPITRKPVQPAVIDPLANARRNVRKTYVNKLNKSFQYAGQDASAFEMTDGELLITSSAVKNQQDADAVIAGSFDVKTQEALCSMGFSSLRVKGNSLFSAGTSYATRCKQTAAERAQNERDQVVKRQAFATQLNRTLTEGTVASAVGTELVFTETTFDPALISSVGPAMVSDTTNLCNLGFTGLRARRPGSAKGALMSFHCKR